MDRPKLNKSISTKDFKEYYWLKEELVGFCKEVGIATSGGKIDLTNRIIEYLETGSTVAVFENKLKPSSKFDWNKETMHLETILTDNYRSTENVRLFFEKQIGSHFHFTVEFMKWTKLNVGKTLKECISEWNRLYRLKKDKNYKSTIDPQFEYNRYMRDFLADNPDKSSKDAMKYWRLKRALPGPKQYLKSDLDLK